ncbi:hypothetical protein SPOG_05690 [Schizosaccharomyces cryophilus OY26]|uniref:Uncharacterized protein n=1 Tax=Schizosaccharomyces cryophilus (strain OY26 / ATCC MYA-4695 / CBS 11777 / NBRC 106824 / NRRL Y48691) TaxID=653667 RepID=S9W565_SCHCR|nr:uncharacterized protein SPOG_05688 [Schizosaccharomyces cryophilus OY26]XP_013022117.1 uncharacterized protein SPOG_05690 [Schizosaccharomyces cryophilus OY26]EPY53065.1 hypothetical protein SPOG_05688 [Schizosaccharomyces cryophilus OY26]EPY53067.1 hypothetical protein SPOG_05690 [Schizosaccharomyces cryophilus OY26]
MSLIIVTVPNLIDSGVQQICTKLHFAKYRHVSQKRKKCLFPSHRRILFLHKTNLNWSKKESYLMLI